MERVEGDGQPFAAWIMKRRARAGGIALFLASRTMLRNDFNTPLLKFFLLSVSVFFSSPLHPHDS